MREVYGAAGLGCLLFLAVMAFTVLVLAIPAWVIMVLLGVLGVHVGFIQTWAAVVLAYVVVNFVRGLFKK